MKIKILGSAAAEAVPALWCECSTCAHARKAKGKDIRRRSAYFIDEDTLVDYGPDIYSQTLEYNIDMTQIKRLFITHSHEDHLDPIELYWRSRGFSVVSKMLDLYANQKSIDVLKKTFRERPFSDFWIREHLLKAGEFTAADDIKLFPVEAMHAGEDEQALNFIIERNGKQLLIANDTGWWQDISWEAVKNFRLDAAIIESTCTFSAPDLRSGHLGANTTLAFRDKLREMGVITEKTKVFTNHFSHNGAPIHSDMEKFFNPHGITVCYDGLDIEI